MEVKEPRSTEVKDAIKMAKDTTRNGLCPCGCGNKAKKCVNGRRVMEFKRLLGSTNLEFVIVWLLLFATFIIFYNARKDLNKCLSKHMKPEPNLIGYTCVDSAAEKDSVSH